MMNERFDTLNNLWYTFCAFRGCGCGSAVERLLAKEKVVGSNPITRSHSRWQMADS